MSHNLFRPGGKRPAVLVGRESALGAFERELREFHDRGRNLCLTGLRGNGKSTLLRSCELLALDLGCVVFRDEIVADANDSERFAAALVHQLEWCTGRCSPSRGLRRAVSAVRPELSLLLANDVRLDLRFRQREPLTTREALRRAFDDLASVADPYRPVVLCYDEAHVLRGDRPGGDEAARVLLSALLQAQEDTPSIMLVLAGLPPTMARMVAARTNVGREFGLVEVKPLDTVPPADGRPSAAARLLLETTAKSDMGVALEQAAAEWIATELKGNPETLQHVGSTLLDAAQRTNVPSIDDGFVDVHWDEAIERMDRGLFDPRYDCLTIADRELLRKVATECGDRFDEQAVRRAAGWRAPKRAAALADRDEMLLLDGDAFTFDHAGLGDYLRRRARRATVT